MGENEFNSNGFGWDIELPIQTREEVVNDFLVGQLPVTNNEFLELYEYLYIELIVFLRYLSLLI